MRPEHLVIIGGGPAAYAAATYAARANLRPLCVEGLESGGLIMTADTVENFPGFGEGVAGPELMLRMREQAERFGTRFLTEDVVSIDLSVHPFEISLHSGEVRADAVVVATGATARRLGLPSEDRFDGYGVAYCAACDGAFFEDKRVLVVGGGDSAMDQAMSLAKIAREVVVVHRRERFRASEIMVGYARAHHNISFQTSCTVQEVLGTGDDGVTGVRLRDERTGDERVEPADGLFVSIGHEPATELFLPFLAHDQNGYLAVAAPSTATSVEGVFAAGDVHDRVYRQVVTATGSGCMAAMDAERWLAHRGGWATTATDGVAALGAAAE